VACLGNYAAIQSFVLFQGDDAWTNLCAAQARLEDNQGMKDSTISKQIKRQNVFRHLTPPAFTL